VNSKNAIFNNNNNTNMKNEVTLITAIRAYSALEVSVDKITEALLTVENEDVRKSLEYSYKATKKAFDELKEYITND
tara:strand:+ start:2055 stop:2285 length:231 start_codon:yes stop_codon:yes gene_type:complete